jgi:nucleoside-diphosphate-sugar epimerase
LAKELLTLYAPCRQADAANFIIGRVKFEGVEVLKKTSLAHTRFYVGFFLDYWGYPHVPTHVTPLTMAVDMQNEFAALPGTGTTPISFVHTVDIAKFVAASLDLPKWDEESYVLGDRLTWNDFVKTAEEVKGNIFRQEMPEYFDLHANRNKIQSYIRLDRKAQYRNGD